MSDAQYQPGVYAKGDVRKTANTQAKAVALVFDGYKRVEDAQAEQASLPEASVTPAPTTPTPTPPRRERRAESQETQDQ
jgi:hypothetical protein